VVAKVTARRDTATAEIERLRTQLAGLSGGLAAGS
jgi:hypothetical protein